MRDNILLYCRGSFYRFFRKEDGLMFNNKQTLPNGKKRTRRLALLLSALMLLSGASALLYYPNTVSADTASAEANAASDENKLKNGSFEEGQTWTNSYRQPNQSEVPYWNTTAFQSKIELFRENTGTYIGGVKLSPTDGTYAAELNADEESTLYQYVKTTPSSVYEWGIDHGARNGADTMALVIGPKQSVDPSKPNKAGRDQFMQMVDWLIAQGKTSFKTEAGMGEHLIVYSKKFASGGAFEDNANDKAFSLIPSTIYTEEWHIWIMASRKGTQGTNPWNSYGSNADGSAAGDESGNTELDLNKYYLYNVPEGQTETLFGFVSVGYVDSIATAGKEKTYGNFLDNINFVIYHPLTGSTTTHGSGIVGNSDGTSEGSGGSTGHEITINNDLKTYVVDGQPLKIQAVIKKEDVDSGCEFVGLYHSTIDTEGNPVTEFLQLSGNVIDYDESLTDEQKKGKWIRSTDTEGNIIFTYYLESVTSPTDLHFIFIKSPTVTYDPNGGKNYIVDRIYNTDEADNVYSYKPATGQNETNPGLITTFIAPYISHAAEGKNDGWKFMGWLLTGDSLTDTEGHELINTDGLGSLLLPAVHTVACDYSLDGVNGDLNIQYFKVFKGNVPLTEVIDISESGEALGVTWTDSGGGADYANIHSGLTMVAQWRWRQAFIPQVVSGSTYDESEAGGTVEIASADPSDTNYNSEYTEKGGKSYHAAAGEIVTATATAKTGYTFVGWYDSDGNLVTPNASLSYKETKESVNTYYARFSDSITQTYIRLVQDGNSWKYTEDDSIGTLDRYTYVDVAGMPISATATAAAGYKFVGWYDSGGNRVEDSMLTGGGATLSYTTTDNATYYARFVPTVKQTYIRQIDNGGIWKNTSDDNIGKLDRYTHIDEIGMPVSSRATAGAGYKFVGWYDSEGNKVGDAMLTGGGAAISYTTTGNATYYARFEKLYSLYVGKIDGDSSAEGNKVPLAGAEFTLYKKDDSGDRIIVYKGESIKCVELGSAATELNGAGTEAIAVFNCLDAGFEYYLCETKAPAGYRLLDTPVKITIDGSGSNAWIDGISKEITEKEVSIELANYLTLRVPTAGVFFTGGQFAVTGLVLLVAATIGLFCYKMSRPKEPRSKK